MANVLVAYYSRSGTTAALAQQLAQRLGADLDEVAPDVSYAGARGYAAGVWHSLQRRAPPVRRGRNPRDYALVVVCSPVWVGRLSAPMRSYLTRFGGQIRGLAALWVSGSGLPYEAVGAEIAALTGFAPVGVASFSQREARRGAASTKLDALARTVRVSLGRVPRAA